MQTQTTFTVAPVAAVAADDATIAAAVVAIVASTLRRVLDAFRELRVGSNMFAGVDGYGHGDVGRETLDKVYARLFGAEAALVSEALVSPVGVVVVVDRIRVSSCWYCR